MTRKLSWLTRVARIVHSRSSLPFIAGCWRSQLCKQPSQGYRTVDAALDLAPDKRRAWRAKKFMAFSSKQARQAERRLNGWAVYRKQRMQAMRLAYPHVSQVCRIQQFEEAILREWQAMSEFQKKCFSREARARNSDRRREAGARGAAAEQPVQGPVHSLWGVGEPTDPRLPVRMDVLADGRMCGIFKTTAADDWKKSHDCVISAQLGLKAKMEEDIRRRRRPLCQSYGICKSRCGDQWRDVHVGHAMLQQLLASDHMGVSAQLKTGSVLIAFHGVSPRMAGEGPDGSPAVDLHLRFVLVAWQSGAPRVSVFLECQPARVVDGRLAVTSTPARVPRSKSGVAANLPSHVQLVDRGSQRWKFSLSTQLVADLLAVGTGGPGEEAARPLIWTVRALSTKPSHLNARQIIGVTYSSATLCSTGNHCWALNFIVVSLRLRLRRPVLRYIARARCVSMSPAEQRNQHRNACASRSHVCACAGGGRICI